MSETAHRVVPLIVHEDEEDVAGFLGGLSETAEEEKQTAEERGGTQRGGDGIG
jgi:hypothetical protein